jgi:hypothetical protein
LCFPFNPARKQALRPADLRANSCWAEWADRVGGPPLGGIIPPPAKPPCGPPKELSPDELVMLPTTASPACSSVDCTMVHSPWIVPGVTVNGIACPLRTTVTVASPSLSRRPLVGTIQLFSGTAPASVSVATAFMPGRTPVSPAPVKRTVTG